MAGLKKKKKTARRGVFRPYCLLAIAAAFALNCVVAITSLTPKRYEVSEGSVVKETITAPRMVEDAAATEALRQTARDNVKPVYSVDLSLADTLISNARSFFSALKSFRSAAGEIRAASAPTQTGVDGQVYALEDTRSWREVISESDLLAMIAKLPVPISDAALGYALLDAADMDLERLQEIVMPKLEVRLRAGVSEDELAKTLSETIKELQITTLPVRLKSLGDTLYNTYLLPTVAVNTVETTRAQEKAASAVETVYIARGAAIVQEGRAVTAEQMQILAALDLVKGAEASGTLNAGVIGYLLCVYAALFLYLTAFEPEVCASSRKMTILLLILVLTLLAQWLCYIIDPRVMPAVFGVLLTCLLVSRSVAQAFNVAFALSMPLLAGGSGATLFGADSILAMASILVSGQITILVAERSSKRGALIGSGTLGGIAGALVIAAGGLILGYSWNVLLVYAGMVMAAALILSVFCVGMLSVWETAFDIVTPARLHELANTNHPLLKKMLTAAPGTYHHSMMAAALAEGAAEAIGANALLARTGAMYHDVGKLRRPLYFKENQTDRNIHDTLQPEESAGYIIAHQKDAEAYLAKYHMPSEIRRIAYEHHGTTLVAYFYFKALKQQETGGEAVVERLFRYPGGLPSTKESAIVMLADSCEAAVRSLGNASREQVAEMVRRVVQGKLDDGQLMQCPLTLGELSRVERSFLLTFGGLMHERVRYPGTELPA